MSTQTVEKTKETRHANHIKHVLCPHCFPIGTYTIGDRVRTLCGFWKTCRGPSLAIRITPDICVMCLEVNVCPECGGHIVWPR